LTLNVAAETARPARRRARRAMILASRPLRASRRTGAVADGTGPSSPLADLVTLRNVGPPGRQSIADYDSVTALALPIDGDIPLLLHQDGEDQGPDLVRR
jgi:hypothetical protein